MLLMDTIGPSACGDSWNSQERRPVLVLKRAPIIRNYSAWTGHSETRVRLSLSLQDSNFCCFCPLLEKKLDLFFLFHYCFALLALLEQAGRIAVIISPDTTPEQRTRRAQFSRCLSSFFFEELRKIENYNSRTISFSIFMHLYPRPHKQKPSICMAETSCMKVLRSVEVK